MTFEEWSVTQARASAEEIFAAGSASRDAEIADLKVVSDHNLTTYHQAAQKLRDEIAELATGLDKSLKCIRYMQGIAERGLGRKMLDEEAPDLFVLSYVKSIEQERDQLREQVTLLRDAVRAELLGADYGRRAMREALAATEPKP